MTQNERTDMRGKEDTKVDLHPITSFRTCAVTGEPDTVVLQIKSGADVRNYALSLTDFAGLAQQMGHDASLLTAGPRMRTA
jgi:hypothetical protein